MNCNKPLTYKYIYCSNCTYKLFSDGLEGKRVRLGQVGLDVINHQQYLHRSIFKCNVLDKYRGLKEDRIKSKVTMKSINIATTRLSRALSCNKYTYNEKIHTNNRHNTSIYKAISDVRNIDKRLIYNILMYYISYHINNNHDFKSFIHFQTSMMNNLLINIERTYIRNNQDVNIKYFKFKRTNNSNKYWYWLFEEIDSLIQPLMNEIIMSNYKG